MAYEKWLWDTKRILIQSFGENEKLTCFAVNVKSEVNSSDFKEEIEKYVNEFDINGITWALDMYKDQQEVVELYFRLVKAHQDDLPINVRQAFSYPENNVSEEQALAQHTINGDGGVVTNQGLQKFQVNALLLCNEIKSNQAKLKPKFVTCTPWYIPEEIITKKHDVLIKGSNYEYWTHRELLEENSAVFKAMFTHDMKENNENTIKMEEHGKEEVRLMLTFMYKGTIDVRSANLNELVRLADKYDTEVLKIICDQHLSLDVNKDNVYDMILQADLYKLMILKAVCVDFIKANYKEVVESEEWVRVAQNQDLIVEITRAMVSLFTD